MNVLISDAISKVGIEILENAGINVDISAGITPRNLESIIKNYDGLIVRSATKVTSRLLERAKKLKCIVRAGTGVDNIDIEAATKRGVMVLNTPGQNANAVAELTVGLILSISRNIYQGTSSLKMCQWKKRALIGHEVAGKVLALIGIGNVGSIVARIARGLKMHVISYDPYVERAKGEEMGIELVEDLDELLNRGDYVSLHLPKTDQTAMLINEDRISKMKDGAYLISTARGGIVDEEAICQALNSGKLSGAALDVFATEPPGACSLIGCRNFICTPHIGASTHEAQQNVARVAGEQLRDYLLRGKIRNAVNQPEINSDQTI